MVTGASAERVARLRAACAQAGLDAFYVRDTSSICWLTAFDGVFDSEPAHALLVLPDRAVLHTDSRYAAACRSAAARAGNVVEVDSERITHAVFAATQAAQAGVRVLGIEDGIALREYRALERARADACDGADALPFELRETDGVVLGLRAVKDAGEVSRMRAAQAVTDAAFTHIVGFMRPGMTERDVQIELEDFMLRHGASGLAFPSIVATGANGASPHAIPGETRLKAGECVVLDFGAVVQGYCSDMTRTVFLGEPSEGMRAAYETLQRANEQVEAALRAGMTGKQAHDLAEQVLDEGGFGGCMGHSLGHGVGIDVHEEPLLSPRNDAPLEPGNVVTVEPGIYLPGEFGMRLEDFGVVTADGFEVFTQSPHEMVIIDRLT